MQSFDIRHYYHPASYGGTLYAANTSSEIARKIGSTIADCCGSQLVTDLALDETNWGLTLAVNDQPVVPEETEEYIIGTFEINGVHFNMKFRK